jgi:hypothetical protein
MSAYSSTSPYYSTPTINGYLDVILFREIVGQTDDILYEIEPKYENRPDLLAYDLYGNVKLWWIFSVRNKDIIKNSDTVVAFWDGESRGTKNSIEYNICFTNITIQFGL